MHILITELLKILEKELGAYQQMLSFLCKEGEAISHAILDDLLRSNGEKETLILQIVSLEKIREELVQKLAAHLGVSAEQITLSFLAQQIGDPLSSDLKSYQNRLSSLIKAAAGKNRENARLLQYSRHITSQLMSILNSQGRLNPLYLSSGAMRQNLPLKGYNQWQA